jgi:hypothetical protein
MSSTDDATIRAIFEVIPITSTGLTITSNVGGRIQGQALGIIGTTVEGFLINVASGTSNTYNVVQNQSIGITAFPQSGYTFRRWVINGQSVNGELQTDGTNILPAFSFTNQTNIVAEYTQVITPDFSITPPPAFGDLVQGTTASSTINISRTGGFSENILFGFASTTDASNLLARGITVTFNPQTVTSESSTRVNVSLTNTATTGSVTVNLVASNLNGSIRKPFTITFNVVASPPLTSNPDFEITAPLSESTYQVTRGSSITIPVTTVGNSDFSGGLGFTTPNLPVGVTSNFPRSTTTGNTTQNLILSASTTAQLGRFLLPINVASTSLSFPTVRDSVSVFLEITDTPDFAITVNPTSRSVEQGGNTTTTVNISRINGFTGSVTLSITGLPQGVTRSFGAITNDASTLTLSVGTSVAPGTYSTTISGTETGTTRTKNATYRLTIEAPPPADTSQFTIRFSGTQGDLPSIQPVLRGDSVGIVGIITRDSNFTSPITLSLGPQTNLPAGVVASISPPTSRLPSSGAEEFLLTYTASNTATINQVGSIVINASGNRSNGTTVNRTLRGEVIVRVPDTTTPTPTPITPTPTPTTTEPERWRNCTDGTLRLFPIPSDYREVIYVGAEGGTCWEPITDIGFDPPLSNLTFTYQRGSDIFPKPYVFKAQNQSTAISYKVILKTNTSYFTIIPNEFVIGPRQTINFSINLNQPTISEFGDGITDFGLQVDINQI